jgi:hypothetical protein
MQPIPPPPSYTWAEVGTPLPPKPETFTLGTILRNLAGGASAYEKSIDRIFAYSFARFGEHVSPQDADRFGLHLARHYTTDYAVSSSPGGLAYVRDFKTVGHVMAMEGAATIVAPDEEGTVLPDFLRDFATATLQKHYVPIALLACHEHMFLVDKTTESNFWPDIRDNQGQPTVAINDVRRLQALREASLEFRLAFRFSQVSVITMHNEVNLGFRTALGLDRMLIELSADVAEASTVTDASTPPRGEV